MIFLKFPAQCNIACVHVLFSGCFRCQNDLTFGWTVIHFWSTSDISYKTVFVLFIQHFIHKRVNGIGQQAILVLSLQQGQDFANYISIILIIYKFRRKKEKLEKRKLQLGTGVEILIKLYT